MSSDQVYVRETNREIEQDPLASNSKFVALDNKGCIICDAHFVTDGFCFFGLFLFYAIIYMTVRI